MSRNVNAPSWVKASIVVALVAAAMPGWFYVAGYVALMIMFRGKPDGASVHTWLDYYNAYGATASIRKPLTYGAVAATLVILAPFAMLFIKPRQTVHGKARFANSGDMLRHGLLTNDGDGVILGRKGEQFLTASLRQLPHVMLAAPTGSGKGVGIV